MYADRHTGSSRYGSGGFNPAGAAAAIGINAAVIAALMLAAPYVGITEPPGPIEIYDVPTDPPPPEPLPKPDLPRQAAKPATLDAPVPIVDRPPTAGPVVFDPLPIPDLGVPSGTPTGTGTTPAAAPPAPAPVIVGPSVDPRYVDDLQPTYPASEQRLGRHGRVTVRVLVGPDGRVREVQPVSATSDAFFAATQTQALRRWRFKPGTRDGVAQEAWRTMTVTFRLED